MRFMQVCVVDRSTHTHGWSCKGRPSLRVKYIPKGQSPVLWFQMSTPIRMQPWGFQDEILMAFGIDDNCLVEEAEFTPEESKCCFGANSREACMDSWTLGQYPRAGVTIRCDFDMSTLSSLFWVRFYEIITEAFEASTFSFFIVFDQVMLLLYIRVHPSKSHIISH